MSMYCFIYGTIHTLFVPLLYYGTWVEEKTVLDDWANRPWSLLMTSDNMVRMSIVRVLVSLHKYRLIIDDMAVGGVHRVLTAAMVDPYYCCVPDSDIPDVVSVNR